MGSVFHRLGEDRAGSVSAVFRAFAVFGVLAFTNNIAEAGNALFHQHPNGLLVIEAEQFQWNQGGRGVAAWQIVSPSGASGGGALKAPTGLFTSAPDTARSDYYANFVSTGYHYLWARVRAFNDGSDSMYVQIDSRTHVQISASNRTGQWHWVRMAGAHYMSSGVHTLKLYRRESNIEVDRFLLTRSSTFVPAGPGPLASPLLEPNADRIYQQAGNGTLAMEAEHYFGNVQGAGQQPWLVVANYAASNGQALKAPWGVTTLAPDKARAEYRANFVQSGYHFLWLRFRAFSEGTDSMYVELDNRGPQQVNPVRTDGTWEWKRIPAMYVAAGLHTVKLYQRESGLEVDRIVLTRSASYAPSGVGPNESQRVASGEPLNQPPIIMGWPSATATVGQKYVFTPLASDPEGATLSFGIQGRPPWATFNSSTGRLAGTPTSAHVGTYSNIRIVVTDGTNITWLEPFTVEVKPAATAPATVRWTAPRKNTDGSPLTDLAGYRVYRGTRPGRYDQVVRVYGAGATQYRFSQLAVGTTQYVVVTSFDTSGKESAPSAEVSLRVQ